MIKSSNKRIAVFLPGLYGGGAERTMLNLAQELASRGIEVDLVLARKEGAYLTEVPKSVRIVELNKSEKGHRRTLGSLPALVRYLRREKPVAMLSILNYANVIAVWARCLAGIPQRMVVNEQNTFSQSIKEFPRLYRWLMLRLVKSFYPLADNIVAVSSGVAEDLSHIANIPLQRIQIIHNPVVTPEIQLKVQASVEDPWFGPDELPVIIAVGRLAPQKDYPTLLKAFSILRDSCPSRLVILGEGDERPKLERLINNLDLDGYVSLPGFVENPYSLISQASVFVLSSRWEGLPTVLIEALFCRVPVVATDCPSGPRGILANGRYGKLVPVGDPSALSKAIEETLSGDVKLPPPESWRPYESDVVADQYINLLLGS